MSVNGSRSGNWMLQAQHRGMEAQLAVWRRTVLAHNLRLGWKIGMNDRPSQLRAGLDAPVLGYLRRDRLLSPGGVFPMSSDTLIKAEIEVALRIGADVAAEVDADEAETAVAAYAPAVEVVDVTRPLNDIESLLGGNLYQAAVLFGTERPSCPATPRQSLQARLRVNGVLHCESEAFRLPERFGEFVRLAAATLARHGERLLAGDWIICGSVIEPCRVSPGSRIEVEMTGCERLTLNFL